MAWWFGALDIRGPESLPAFRRIASSGSSFRVSAPTIVDHDQRIQLTSDSTSYRYWLVWVTTLGNHDSLAIDEVVLYK